MTQGVSRHVCFMNIQRAIRGAILASLISANPVLRVPLVLTMLLGLTMVMCCQQAKEASADPQETSAENNAAIIKGAYEAFGRGDIASVFAVFAEDILWHVPGRGPLSREYRGHDGVRGFFEQFMRLSDGTFRISIDKILAKDDRVVVLCTETARRAGRTWTSPQVHVWTVRAGQAIGFWEFEGDQQSEDEFWSSNN